MPQLMPLYWMFSLQFLGILVFVMMIIYYNIFEKYIFYNVKKGNINMMWYW